MTVRFEIPFTTDFKFGGLTARGTNAADPWPIDSINNFPRGPYFCSNDLRNFLPSSGRNEIRWSSFIDDDVKKSKKLIPSAARLPPIFNHFKEIVIINCNSNERARMLAIIISKFYNFIGVSRYKIVAVILTVNSSVRKLHLIILYNSSSNKFQYTEERLPVVHYFQKHSNCRAIIEILLLYSYIREKACPI